MSKVWLFVDDIIAYLVVKPIADTATPQSDIDKLAIWKQPHRMEI